MIKYLVGVDEAGRGPLAGPVAVGMVKIPVDFDWALIPGVGDSKKLSEKTREDLYERAKELRYRGLLDFSVAQVGPSVSRVQPVSSAPRVGHGTERSFALPPS